MEISVIIVAYNSDEYIENCLKSIVANNDLQSNEIEIIIVNNHPTTSRYLEMCVSKCYCARLVKNTINNGFGGGNNVGASFATGDILLFLNPDTVFFESVFVEVIKKFKDPNLGALGCTLVDQYGTFCNSYGYFPECWGVITSLLNKFFQTKGRIYKAINVYPWGANLFVRNVDFHRVGKFDTNFFLCHEEADLCTRLKPKTVYILDKQIIHYEGHTTVHQGKRFESWLSTLIQYHQKFGYDLNKSLFRYEATFFVSIIFRLLSGKDWYPLLRNLIKLRLVRKSIKSKGR